MQKFIETKATDDNTMTALIFKRITNDIATLIIILSPAPLAFSYATGRSPEPKKTARCSFKVWFFLFCARPVVFCPRSLVRRHMNLLLRRLAIVAPKPFLRTFFRACAAAASARNHHFFSPSMYISATQVIYYIYQPKIFIST